MLGVFSYRSKWNLESIQLRNCIELSRSIYYAYRSTSDCWWRSLGTGYQLSYGKLVFPSGIWKVRRVSEGNWLNTNKRKGEEFTRGNLGIGLFRFLLRRLLRRRTRGHIRTLQHHRRVSFLWLRWFYIRSLSLLLSPHCGAFQAKETPSLFLGILRGSS